ncbi:hypothetical protein [Methylibium sp.]|uniref:hypothetical protein n=1 Tax=Methylibium sp. TaxID=2067992 RepID=UPI0025D30101|nr:hypothetical protein [Methylibium sp.]
MVTSTFDLEPGAVATHGDRFAIAHAVRRSCRSCVRRWVFRKSVTGVFGIVTDGFGNVTGHFGDVTDDPSLVS